jgi:CubicO group peptidase (beta-lactamase class C family)
LGAGASVVSTSLFPTAMLEAPRRPGADALQLDRYNHDYMRAMFAPGMILACTEGDNHWVTPYGYSNVESRQPVTPDQPFWIGSIGKSFVGLIAMQLRDEGKLDLHRPIFEILPALPLRNDFGPISAHHLLTHTSGLPNWLQLISSDPAQQAAQAYAPGVHFAYCNLGFDTLGMLLAHLDGRPWPEVVRERIFIPLGMTGASGKIDAVAQARMPTGYCYLYHDRPSAVSYEMVPVGHVMMTDAAGSIAATGEDMAKYMQMLASGGIGPKGRLVSAESFTLFSTPYIKAPVLSTSSSYGYGIGVDTIDGHKMLRHTGGATAFASSILVDLDAGVGAFASINSMQGYRPNPVTLFAVRAMVARKAKAPLASLPPIEDPLDTKNAAQFAGKYTAPQGETLTVTATGDRLTITSRRGSCPLYSVGADTFTAADGSVLGEQNAKRAPSEFALLFGREERSGTESPPGLVNQLSIGPRWYAGERYNGPKTIPSAESDARFVGSYHNDSPWYQTLRIVQRGGKLWLNGTEELHPAGQDSFSVKGGEGDLQLQFFLFFDSRAHLVRMDGESFRRVEL